MSPEHVELPAGQVIGIVLDRAHVAHVPTLIRRLHNDDMKRLLSVFRQQESMRAVVVAGLPAEDGIAGGVALNDSGAAALFGAVSKHVEVPIKWLVWADPALIAQLQAAATSIEEAAA